MSDNTSRIGNDTARIDGTMRVGTQGSNAAGEVFDDGKTVVLNGKTCVIQSRLNLLSGEALVYKVSIEGKPYALKHYRIDRPLSDTALKALDRIRVHPKNRIIRIYDFGKYNGQDFEIMEFAEGGTLSSYLKNSGAVQNIQQLKNIVAQIHEGLRQLHGEYRIIYQDLKPENIYFRDAAKTAIVLGDFGISSVMEEDDDEAEVIANLTDLYAAPELARKGDRREVVVTPAVDYFALGITMFELWLGEEPFNGMKPAKRDHIIRNKEVILPPDMNEDCKTLIQGLLDPMPKTRWGNQHVQKWLDGARLSVGVTRSYDEVTALYNAGRFDEALPLFQTLAEQGSARAQNKMGECYYNANGVGYDEKKALEWFLKAAKRGNADAFANLGECYELGNGVRQNLETAAKWYRKAAKQGNTDAQTRYDKIMSKRNSAKESSSSSYSGRPHYNDYDSYDSHDSGGRAGMFFLTFLAILPKLIRFIIIPLIVMFFIFSFVKYLKKIPDTLFGALDSTFEQILGTEDVTGRTASVTADAANFRAGPSTSHDIIKTLKKGDTLTVTGPIENGWVPVKHGSDTGWVSADLTGLASAGSTAAGGPGTTAQTAAPQQTQAPAVPSVPVKEGIYLIRPRIQAKENGVTPLELWLDRIEVRGQNFSAFYTGAPEGKGGDGRFQLFWYNPEHIKLESLNGDGKKYDVVSVDEDDDSSNPRSTNGFSNTFQGVAGTRFRLASIWPDMIWAFNEFVLGEPDR